MTTEYDEAMLYLNCIKRWASNLSVADTEGDVAEVIAEMSGECYYGIAPATDWKLIREKLAK